MIRKKNCSICENKVFYNTKTKKLRYGYSFGRVKIPAKDAKIIYKKEEIIPGLENLGMVTVIDHDKHVSFEYIECDDCYHSK